MTVQLLIDAIVKQTTVLIAQLATSGGLRAPLAHVANQVFVDLNRELEDHGISRKVRADMFGMALRAYLRKVQRLSESSTDRGHSLWEAVYAFLGQRPVVTRKEVLDRFHRDDEDQVRSVLHDLTESGLVFATGVGPQAAYRVASQDELDHLARSRDADELIWAIIFREGPLTMERLIALGNAGETEMRAAVDRLVQDGRVQCETVDGTRLFDAARLTVPLDATAGWEAAVFDHFHAMVQTICRKLNREPRASASDAIGGSTYTLDIWPGHPLEERVRGAPARFREEHTQLRADVARYNDAHAAPPTRQRVVVYGGQYVAEEAE